MSNTLINTHMTEALSRVKNALTKNLNESLSTDELSEMAEKIVEEKCVELYVAYEVEALGGEKVVLPENFTKENIFTIVDNSMDDDLEDDNLFDNLEDEYITYDTLGL